MENQNKNFANDYIELMEKSIEVINNFDDTEKPSPIMISTMTIIVVLKNRITLTKELVLSEEAKKLEMTIDVPKPKKDAKKSGSFYNQITLKYKDTLTQKSIKVFSNGKLQMTGITSFIEAIVVSELISAMFNNTIQTINIAMINSNFSLNCGLNVIKLQDLFKKCENVQAIYDPDVYPGLKVYYNSTSAFIFNTGNIVITGAKSIKDINKSYTFIMEIISNNWKNIKNKFHTRKNKLKEQPIVKGYRKSSFDCCKLLLEI